MAAYLGLGAKSRGSRPAQQVRRERRPVDPGGAHRGQRRRLVALGEPAAVVVE